MRPFGGLALAFIGLLLGVLLLVGCGYQTTGPEPQGGPADVQILSEDFECSGRWDCHITGVVENRGDGDAELVSVKAEFFDQNGIRLDTGWDYIGDLRPGQSAYYDISCWWLDGCPATYDIWVDWWE